MRVLIACEESQTVCKAFREHGHEAYSCDIQDCSGGHPEWHIKGDVIPLLNGNCHFVTVGGDDVMIDGRWDLIVAHPPCTYLTPAGSCYLFNADGTVKDLKREVELWKSVVFFLRILYADCQRICVENPAPMKYCQLPQYTQIIEPYFFGDPWKKRTCLWLKGLPPLCKTDVVEPKACWVETDGRTCRTKLRTPGIKGVRSAKERSKTFPGIAKAMAEQWG